MLLESIKSNVPEIMLEYGKLKRPAPDKAYYKLSEAASLLEISEELLLKDGCLGRIQFFVRVPADCEVFSVHEDAIDLGGPQIWAGRFVRRTPVPDPGVSCPIRMSDFGIDGFLLAPADCQEVGNRSIFTQYIFHGGCRVNLGEAEFFEPLHGQYPFLTCSALDRHGWRLAAYKRNHAPRFINGVGYSRPLSIDLSIDNLFVTNPDLNHYINSAGIDAYVDECFDGCHVRSERPSYFSERLNYVIDTSEKFWRNANQEDPQDLFNRNRKVVAAFEDREFHTLFGKGRASRGVRDVAEKFIKPVFARSGGSVTKEVASQYRGYITPELEMLMAASKRYWGQPSICLEDPNTYPPRDDIVAFLVNHGITQEDAKFGATILTPLGVAHGPRRPKSPADKLK